MSNITPPPTPPPPEDPNNGGGGGGSLNSNPVSLKRKRHWSREEDAILTDYVMKNGARNWDKVSRESGLDRDLNSCRNRWMRRLSFDQMNKFSLSPQEETNMIYLHHKYRGQWSIIVQYFQGRTAKEIKNFWNARIEKCMKYNLPIYPPEIVQYDQPEQIATQQPSNPMPNVMLSNTHLCFPSSNTGPWYNYEPTSQNLSSNLTYIPRRRRIANPDEEWETFLDNNLLPFQ